MGKRRGNGEGTIVKRPSGTWFGQVSYFDPATGKQKRKTVSGKTKADVVNKMQEARTLKARGRLTEQCKLTLSEWLDTWLEDYKKAQLKLSTYDSYYRLINSHLKPKLGGLKLTKLTTNDIQKFYIEKLTKGRKNPIITTAEDGSTSVNKGLSTRTVKYMHMILQEALDQAVKENFIYSNPAHNTTQPRQVKREIQPLSTSQVQDFLAAIHDDYLYPLYLTELGTGLRRGELLGLKWDDINMDKATAVIKRSLLDIKGRPYLQEDVKTRKSKRTVTFPEEVFKEMKRLKVRQAEDKLAKGQEYNDQGFVFCWQDGRPIPPNHCYHHFKALLKTAGLPSVRFHDLRHSFATILLEQGEDINTISKLLGHQSISITMDIYAHLTESMQSKAAATMNGILTKGSRKSAAGN